MNDNRNYHYGINSQTQREEYKIITDWIVKGSTVIDLGCGDGSLLQLLKLVKRVHGLGIDSSASAIAAARRKGIKADVGLLDEKLRFKNKQFEYALCNVTVQMVMYPEILLSEMKRIAHHQIVSFPNFAFFLNRLELLFYGRMPRLMLSGYQWYNTGHIHQLSISDFEIYCKHNGLRIINSHFNYFSPLSFFSSVIPSRVANLCATLAIFMTK